MKSRKSDNLEALGREKADKYVEHMEQDHESGGLSPDCDTGDLVFDAFYAGWEARGGVKTSKKKASCKNPYGLC